jgi:hypothetical protein
VLDGLHLQPVFGVDASAFFSCGGSNMKRKRRGKEEKERKRREKGNKRKDKEGLKSQEGKAWVADKCVLASSRQFHL